MAKVKELKERRFLKMAMAGDLDAEAMALGLGMSLVEFVRFTQQEHVRRLLEDLAHAEDLMAQVQVSRRRTAAAYGLLRIGSEGGDETVRKAWADVLKVKVVRREGGGSGGGGSGGKKVGGPTVVVDEAAAAEIGRSLCAEGERVEKRYDAVREAGEKRRAEVKASLQIAN